MKLQRFKNIYERKYNGYEVLDIELDKPARLDNIKDQKKFIKNNIDKLDNENSVDKLYLDMLNCLGVEHKKVDEKIDGYIIIGRNNHTNVDMFYRGHTDKKALGYIHIDLYPFGKIEDIIYNKVPGKPFVFKHKDDAKEVKNILSQVEEYYFVDFKVKKITLSRGFFY
jgi:hypothetical protein